MKTTWMATLGAAVLATALAGCGSDVVGGSGDGGNSDEYHVVVLGGLSAEGILADNSATSVNAAKASVAYANDNGGVNGKNVVIDVIDDQGDPTVAVTKLRELIAEGKPDLVLNSGPSTVADATLPILTQNGILSFNIGPTETSSDPEVSPLNFDIAVAATEQLHGLAPYINGEGFTKVAVLHGNSAYGQTYGTAAEEVLTEEGLDVTANEEYDVAALDMTAQLEAIKATNPDVMVIDAYGAPLGYILKGVAKLDWDVKMIGNTSVSATSLTATEPPEGLVGTDEVANLVMEVPKAAVYDANNEGMIEAVQRMNDAGGIKSSLILGYNYDTLPLVMAAAEAADSTDAEDIAAELVKPEVQEAANTEFIDVYGFSAELHAPQNVDSQYTFIAPSILKDGQFQ